MCGISGILNLNKERVSSSDILSMMTAMKHRGPDDEGIYIDNDVGLGFVRLSIIDLTSAGHQPMYSFDKRYVIVFNGEIFNYIELRNVLKQYGYIFKTESDTEVLINSYIEWGEECQHKFNGMWAFAIFDTRTRKLFLSRDRYGIKPLYYYRNNNMFAFASEIPSILKILDFKPDANEQVIYDYLIFNRTDQTHETFFQNIYKLQHGHSISINFNQKVTIEKPNQWYNLKKEITKKNKSRISVEEFKTIFEDAVSIRLRSDVPIGVCLSGGLDSSSIVSTLLKKFRRNDISTFSAVYNKGQYGDESEFIKLYDTELDTMLFTFPTQDSLLADLDDFVNVHAEPFSSTSIYAQYKVMELASKHAVVTLDGQGADEMLAGYHYFFGFYFKDLLKNLHIIRLTKELFAYLKIHKSFYGLKSLIFFLLPSNFRTKVRVNEKCYLKYEFNKKYSKSNSITDNLYSSKSLNDALINHFEYKLEHLLKWEDRNSMAFSLEARVPFLDHRLVEATLRADGRDIIINGMTKAPLREAMKGILPERIRVRVDKIGFGTPQDEWFRDKRFDELISEILDSESFRNRNIIDVDKAKVLYIRHQKNEINISQEIWKWIHLELWFRAYID